MNDLTKKKIIWVTWCCLQWFYASLLTLALVVIFYEMPVVYPWLFWPAALLTLGFFYYSDYRRDNSHEEVLRMKWGVK